ncbi:hypothetical protein J4430_01435 [Candidatus Woesearchaeota archaeon]|nr:hypothetical protein [Candidatus Woesearchaeota archaeon]
MRIIIIVFGLLTTFAGVWPILVERGFAPLNLLFIPASGTFYYGMVTAIGLLTLLYGLKKSYHYT